MIGPTDLELAVPDRRERGVHERFQGRLPLRDRLPPTDSVDGPRPTGGLFANASVCPLTDDAATPYRQQRLTFRPHDLVDPIGLRPRR